MATSLGASTVSVEAKLEANVRQAVPFFGVSDIERSVRYYTESLGFVMTNKWIHEGKLRWCWLELGEAALMLQEFWREGHHANVPTEKLGVGVSICFTCRDALAIYRELRSKGVEAQRPFVGNAMWVTSVSDPDGYKLFFESPTNAPEESEYSEAL
ncbi:MAG TPA: VOC family protein [Terriglobales bacterium]|nr:VOC family protein [Terriglobales bacterium]